VGGALGLALGAALPSVDAALEIGKVLTMVFIIFGGLYFDLSTLPHWLQPLSALSPVKHAWDGFVANEFSGLVFEDVGDRRPAKAGAKVYADGAAVLSEIGLGPETVAASIAHLSCLLLALHLLSYLALASRAPRFVKLAPPLK